MSTLMDTPTLIHVGRELPDTFSIMLGDQQLHVQQVLRLLPGRRIAARARLDEQEFFVKIFMGSDARRYAEREQAGALALMAAGIDTPTLHNRLDNSNSDIIVLCFEWLADAQPLSAAYASADPHTRSMLLDTVAREMAHLHQAGVVHLDCHPDNFLLTQGRLFLIDGDGIREAAGEALLDNMALFFAQLPLADEALFAHAWAAYTGIRQLTLAWAIFRPRWQHVLDQRLRKLAKKVQRDCSDIQVTQNWRHYSACRREAAHWLAPVLDNPDHWLNHYPQYDGQMLKDGNTSTVVRVSVHGHPVVIKRYNIKSLRHRIERALVPSRARHSWVNAFLLQALGIHTPSVLACIEERNGPLHARAWLICEYSAAPDVHSAWIDRHFQGLEPATEMRHLTQLFSALATGGIVHGDMKANNVLTDGQSLSLIDLDSLRRPRTALQQQRGHLGDQQRFRRNFLHTPALLASIDAAQHSTPC